MTNQRVYIIGFDVMENDRVTVRMVVSGAFNFVLMERQVFGVDPAQLVECDLPQPDEIVGSHDVSVETLRAMHGLGPHPN